MDTLILHSMRWTPCCPHADQNTTEAARTTLKDEATWRLQVKRLQGTPTAGTSAISYDFTGWRVSHLTLDVQYQLGPT